MNKPIFEQMGGTYTVQGDYCLPDLTLPIEEERPIGVWAQRRLRYLKQMCIRDRLKPIQGQRHDIRT